VEGKQVVLAVVEEGFFFGYRHFGWVALVISLLRRR
jgi:hypothetical protein